MAVQDIHKELEDKISRFHEREDAILYASCFDANAGNWKLNLAIANRHVQRIL